MALRKTLRSRRKNSGRREHPHCIDQLQEEELSNLPESPDPSFFASLLRNCSLLSQGRYLHRHIALSGLEPTSRFLANMLIHMYGTCGSIDDAWIVFGRMQSPRNVFSWNIMFSANASNRHFDEAQFVFNSMPQHDNASWTLCIAMFARSGQIVTARNVFDAIFQPDVTAWNAIIAVYAETGHNKEAQAVFQKLDLEGVHPDSITLISVLDSCDDIQLGKTIHSEAELGGFLDSSVNLGTALVTMYGRCGSLIAAEQSFSRMPRRNVVSWSAMTAAFARNGEIDRAELTFERIPSHCSISANTMIWAFVQSSQLQRARKIFDGMLERDRVSWSSMLCGYTQRDHLHLAREFFHSMPGRFVSVSAWNTIVAAYARAGDFPETVHLFKRMDLEGFPADELTFSSAFEACSGLSDVRTGRILHENFDDHGLPLDEYAGTSLVTMYGSSGSLEEAEAVFSAMPSRNAVAWNAMIAAYDHNGRGKRALEKFREMELVGELPDQITFITALAACSHVGRVEIGREFFSKMADYEICPVVDHYLCMLDLLGRAGRLQEAEELLESMPFVPDDVALTTLLAASRVLGDARKGATAADKAVKMEGGDSSFYVLLSNAYTSTD
ncbi:pentatricopeptide repeat-containing protein At2g13600-like [Selaginella moellendorffii]|uniref:pentatricopeptide repeat-containing protein At2g13600-like n=1 Tax=Selaginella moellendorffii TaxID=88036 RepID=UPI000D1C9DE3|nr:pentatricopeptide repeat-containing protein At2g13600-like [Selaginella moellendorffii]|eukprot:XP_024545272.1 pentatricopeptide repeat-containing protein At2g13600-like [Selaginella moellendorffii]